METSNLLQNTIIIQSTSQYSVALTTTLSLGKWEGVQIRGQPVGHHTLAKPHIASSHSVESQG
jgi:hypothetical protein